MGKWGIYTPEGVQDILFEECYIKRSIESILRAAFTSRGFFEIETPTIEFFDVFSGENELISQESMFKFFDPSGRILVLRPDYTIPAARIAANKLKDFVTPVRLSYIGNTFRYDEMGGGRQKEFTQAGVEVLGVSDAAADAEVIATSINALRAVGLERFQIDIGQIEFFKGIMEETGLSDDEIEQVRHFIDTKDFLGLEELLESHDMTDVQRKNIISLPSLFGGMEVIDKAKSLSSNQRSQRALDNLQSVVSILNDYGLQSYISIDLGMVQSINYYTGTIFKGFTHGVGFPILAGGRYDTLVEKFGKNLPATGFAIGVNLLMMALDRQKPTHVDFSKFKQEVETLICYGKDGRAIALKLAEELREQKMIVEVDVGLGGIDAARGYCEKKSIGGILYVIDDNTIDVINIQTGETVRTSVKEILKGAVNR